MNYLKVAGEVLFRAEYQFKYSWRNITSTWWKRIVVQVTIARKSMTKPLWPVFLIISLLYIYLYHIITLASTNVPSHCISCLVTLHHRWLTLPQPYCILRSAKGQQNAFPMCLSINIYPIGTLSKERNILNQWFPQRGGGGRLHCTRGRRGILAYKLCIVKLLPTTSPGHTRYGQMFPCC